MNGVYLYFVNKDLSSWPLLGLLCKELKKKKKKTKNDYMTNKPKDEEQTDGRTELGINTVR